MLVGTLGPSQPLSGLLLLLPLALAHTDTRFGPPTLSASASLLPTAAQHQTSSAPASSSPAPNSVAASLLPAPSVASPASVVQSSDTSVPSPSPAASSSPSPMVLYAGIGVAGALLLALAALCAFQRSRRRRAHKAPAPPGPSGSVEIVHMDAFKDTDLAKLPPEELSRAAVERRKSIPYSTRDTLLMYADSTAGASGDGLRLLVVNTQSCSWRFVKDDHSDSWSASLTSVSSQRPETGPQTILVVPFASEAQSAAPQLEESVAYKASISTESVLTFHNNETSVHLPLVIQSDFSNHTFRNFVLEFDRVLKQLAKHILMPAARLDYYEQLAQCQLRLRRMGEALKLLEHSEAWIDTRVKIGYAPRSRNELELKRGDRILVFYQPSPEIGYAINMQTKEIGFLQMSHLEKLRPAGKNPNRLSTLSSFSADNGSAFGGPSIGTQDRRPSQGKANHLEYFSQGGGTRAMSPALDPAGSYNYGVAPLPSESSSLHRPQPSFSGPAGRNNITRDHTLERWPVRVASPYQPVQDSSLLDQLNRSATRHDARLAATADLDLIRTLSNPLSVTSSTWSGESKRRSVVLNPLPSLPEIDRMISTIHQEHVSAEDEINNIYRSMSTIITNPPATLIHSPTPPLPILALKDSAMRGNNPLDRAEEEQAGLDDPPSRLEAPDGIHTSYRGALVSDADGRISNQEGPGHDRPGGGPGSLFQKTGGTSSCESMATTIQHEQGDSMPLLK
ncbi:uncharacterized protein BJ171DRAFT_600445 [Polychytrium aggregatum]|uniref:uncharacterized protein n=1 Tax=Polychytrium aggregatum TaxID=110093 RepID=UPI0022FDB8DF|nr:uncharacterized protein BJ171DRAFT_600445 [Polychytrium aggregatum]KAI9202999.1 hypothetical protein BJ171DRAFT_600445 [Polychytrium aggregatum]